VNDGPKIAHGLHIDAGLSRHRHGSDQLEAKLARFSEHRQPPVVGQFDGHDLKHG
jgi:hypothetical protein